MPVSHEELQREVPSEMVQNVLPKNLADRLLRHLIADAPTWHRGQWIMFGKTHAAPRTSCYYSLADGQVGLLLLFPSSNCAKVSLRSFNLAAGRNVDTHAVTPKESVDCSLKQRHDACGIWP